jgi:hypothetical protein
VTLRVRFAALALAAALAACGKSGAPQPGLLLNEPSAVAPFHGLTPKYADVHAYLAIANAGGNDLAIIDAVDDSIVPAPTPVPLRTRVFPVAGRPTLLASANLGDDNVPDPTVPGRFKARPDLLVAVSAGDVALQLIRTWTSEGAVHKHIDLGADILALVAVPSPPGTARIAAALSGERLTVVTFQRSSPTDDSIVVVGDTVPPSDPLVIPPGAPLGIQPVALAVTPGNQDRVWAATQDPLPVTGKLGVAGINVTTGTPVVAEELDALAPTRLVTALRLRERGAAAADLDPEGWATVHRVYAVLDESGCGDAHAVACGIVALDADGTGLAPDFVDSTTGRAPIAVPGRALALAASGGPEVPPSTDPADATYQAPFMRMFPATGARRTTGAAAVASTDGALYFVDLGRWEIPSDQAVQATVPVVASADPQVVATTLRATPGYTPTARWTATYQGALPGLASRRLQRISDTRVAFQVPSGGGFAEVVTVAAVGIAPDDLLDVIDPTAVGSCAPSFEARVTALEPPSPAAFPGGALDVAATLPQCLAALADKTNVRATVRAKEWVLVRGAGAGATLAGRPQAGVEHAVPARRISYVPELGDPVGPALAFTLQQQLPPGQTAPTRGASVVIDTTEGRTPFRAVDAGAFAVEPRAVVPFDRSRYAAGSGIRFLVPYASGLVLDATPTLQGGNATSLR